MKALSLSNLLAIGLALAAGEVRAGMMQSSGGNWQQQFTSTGQGMTARQSSGNSQPAFIGRGYGFEGQPTPAAQFAQPGHSIIRAQPASNHDVGSHQNDSRHMGGFGHEMRFGHGTGFDQNHFRHHQRNSIVVFVNGTPCWYPVYTAYPYSVDVLPPIESSGANYNSDSGYVPPMDTGATDAGPAQTAPTFGDLGASWGQDLRRDVVTWSQFVDYLKTYIVAAPPQAQADFREAFISAYRINGTAAYDKAAVEAAGNPPQPQGPKIITMPPPED